MVAVDLPEVRGWGHPSRRVSVLGRASVLGPGVGHDVGQRQGLRAGTQLFLQLLLLLDLLSGRSRGLQLPSLKGMKRLGMCRCRKTNQISGRFDVTVTWPDLNLILIPRPVSKANKCFYFLKNAMLYTLSIYSYV